MFDHTRRSSVVDRFVHPAHVAILGTLLLTACGGGGGGGGGGNSTPTPPQNQSVGGIWKSQYTVTTGPNTGDTINAEAIVTEQGDFFTAARNANTGCASVGFGQGSVTNGSAVNATADWALVSWTTVAGITPNCVEPDGATYGTATITGSVTQRQSLTLTDTDTDSMSTAYPAVTATWTYDSLYALAPSYSTISGNYTDGSDTLTISGSGAIFEQDPTSGCVINGQVNIPNGSYNAYSFTITYASCTGADAGLNGVTATGLGYYDNTTNPNQIDVGWKATVNGQTAVLIGVFPKQ